MKVHDEHLSKEDKQVIADEAEAERKFQAEKARAGAPPSKEGPAGGFQPPKEAGGKTVPRTVPLAPSGTQILRQVSVENVDHYYIIGLAPPYAGAAMWVDILPTKSAEETQEILAERLRRA